MLPEQFYGVWRLISYEFRLAEGIRLRPMGQGVRGLLVYERRQMIIHHVQGASFPNWVGNDRELFFEFAGKCLTLMTLPMPLAGEQAVGYLTWERVGEAK
jgi:hypothetical protein